MGKRRGARLPPLHALEQVAELLNLPGNDQVELGEDALEGERVAVLLAQIAAWAADGAMNAKYGIPDYLQFSRRYAYLIESIDEHSNRWWDVDQAASSCGIEESADGAEACAIAVLIRFLDRVRADKDDYEYLLDDDTHLRVSVWDIDSVVASWRAFSDLEEPPDPARFVRQVKGNKIAANAVEVRTPVQVNRHIRG